MPKPKPVAIIRVVRMTEAGKGHSWWPTLVNSIGQTITPHMFRNRDHALIEADTWGSFLGIEVEPYEEDGVVIEPSLRMGSYDDEDEGRGAGSEPHPGVEE